MKISDMLIKHLNERGVDYFFPQVKFLQWYVTLEHFGGYGVGEFTDYVSFYTKRECEEFCEKYVKKLKSNI